MKTTLALPLTFALAAVATAADPNPPKPVDTSFLKKYAETRRFMLGRPQNPKVAPDGKTVLFLRADADKPTLKLFEFDVASGKSKELLSPATLLKGGDENLSPEEKARRERMRLSAGGFADFHFDKDGKNVLLPLSGKLFVFERATGKVTELKTGEGSIVDPKWSPDGTKVAYVRGYDVYVYDLASQKESPVTTGGTITKTHGLAEFVAQEEMGRFTGYWWSPDGKHIAYEEADHTGVEVWYVADPFRPDAKPAEQFYPRPGKKNVSVRLGVIPVTGGETVWVEWDRKKFEYLAVVRWDAVKADPQGRLTVQLQNREQQTVSLNLADHRTGKLREVAFDENRTFVNLFPELPRWFDDGDRFIWTHHVDADVWLDLRRASKPELTLGYLNEIRPRELLSFDPAGGPALLSGWVRKGKQDPTSQILSKIEWRSDDLPVGTVLAPDAPGQYSATASRGLSVIATTESTLAGLPRTAVWKDGKRVGELPSVAAKPDFEPNVKVEKVGDYWTAVVRPRDFDPKKKYPVVVDVYGGPKHLHVVQAMRNWLVPQWLADQGFIVVAVDNRGTPGRGREWESAVYQKFGTVPLEDQVKGLHALCAKYPELDKDRVGIVGWSFGGYMAANGVLRAPDTFKAAVAGAPVTDWEDYDTHYTERYMGLLPESKKAYDEASLLPLAKNLKRPLLLVHGTADDNVYYRHSLKLADALFRAGKEFDALPLPGVTHMYTSDPVVMERLWARTATFFQKHLGSPK